VNARYEEELAVKSHYQTGKSFYRARKAHTATSPYIYSGLFLCSRGRRPVMRQYENSPVSVKPRWRPDKTEFVGFVEREDVKERRRSQTTRDFLLVFLKQSSYVLVVWHRDAAWLKTREFSVTPSEHRN